MKVVGRLRAVLLSFFLTVAAGLPCLAGQAEKIAAAGVADGAGVWVNIWNYPEGDVNAYCNNLRRHGIRNLFIQTSRSNTPAIKHPEQLGLLIDACHRHKIRVVAWSFAELVDPVADADKMVEAALFKSPSGQRIDAIAPNLEKNLSEAGVAAYCRRLTERLGGGYPMMAVVFSPLNRSPEVAGTPWRLLGRYFDTIAPMTYWGGKYQKLDAYTYAAETARKVRSLVGRPDIEVHLVGDGMGTALSDFRRFLEACRDHEVTGASLYPNHKVTGDQLACLSRYAEYFPANSRFRLAAFRELHRAGAIAPPPACDPSQVMRRGDFYRLVVGQLHRQFRQSREGSLDDSALAITAEEATQMLAGMGLLPAGMSQPDLERLLSAPVPAREALELIAAFVDTDSGVSALKGNQDRQRRLPSVLGSWFAPPASAQELPAAEEPPARPVSYLEAAQIVLEARAGLR